MFKANMIEVFSRIAVRNRMIWRPSCYTKSIQPITQAKRPNPQPNPNLTLLRIISVNMYRAAQEIKPSRWVSKS